MTTKTSESGSVDGTPPRKKLTVENVRELKAVLENTEPKPRLSSREAIAEILPQIRDLQAKGYTISNICEMINDNGFDMPLSTFRSYLAKEGYRRNKRRKSMLPKVSENPQSQPAKDEPQKTDATGGGTARFSVEVDKKL